MEEKRDKTAESFKQEYDEMEERIDDALECLGREYIWPSLMRHIAVSEWGWNMYRSANPARRLQCLLWILKGR